MPKKTSTKTELVAPVTDSVITPIIESSTSSVPVEKKSRKSKTVASSNVVETPINPLDSTVGETVVETVVEPVVDTVVETVVETPDVEAPLTEQSNDFFEKLQKLGVMISSLKTEFRSLEKKWSRQVKIAQKQFSKRKRKAGNRAPSGFVKPTKISEELALFLGKEIGTEMARTDVTREINTYIRAQKLQDKDNGRKINPDAKLAVLLKLKKSDELTYFNLQKYMSPHFAKANKEPLVTV